MRYRIQVSKGCIICRVVKHYEKEFVRSMQPRVEDISGVSSTSTSAVLGDVLMAVEQLSLESLRSCHELTGLRVEVRHLLTEEAEGGHPPRLFFPPTPLPRYMHANCTAARGCHGLSISVQFSLVRGWAQHTCERFSPRVTVFRTWFICQTGAYIS